MAAPSPSPSKAVALYARVSTGGQTVEAQLPALRDYAARLLGQPAPSSTRPAKPQVAQEESGSVSVAAEVREYVDHAVSGRRTSRPALDALMAAARRRELSHVVVVRLDRLARSLAHMAALGDELRDLGVELVSLREGIDTSTASGRAMLGMCGVFSQLEADLIRERSLAGLAAARSRGAQLGQKPLERRVRDRVRRLHRSGHSYRAIAQLVGISKSAVGNVVTGARLRQSEASVT